VDGFSFLAIAIEIDRQQLHSEVLRATRELGVNAANAITIIDVDNLPKTATGKIQRKKLAEYYELEYSHQDKPIDTRDPRLADSSPIQAIFCKTLNLNQIQPQDTFISLGGDSLSYVEFSIQLERHLGYLPKKWEQMPLKELEKLVPQRRRNTVLETNILLRALAIIGIVCSQSGLHHLEGGAYLLLLIAGLNFSRFQGCSLMQGRLQSILPPLRHLLIPYLILVFAYQFYKQNFDPYILLLAANFQLPELQNSNAIFFVWFIANLVQTVILFSLPFSIRAVRNFANRSPWRFGLISLGIGISTRLLYPYIWDTSYLYDQVPHMLFWLFAFGWCINFAKSRVEKIVTTVIGVIIIPSFWGLSELRSWWVLIGAMMLLWLPYVPIPKITADCN
jgi:hypothetical protein